MDNDIFEKIAETMPIERGDRVLFASDITNAGYEVEFDRLTGKLHQFVDLLKEKVGEEGTLLFPTYNWDFCKGKPFNYKKTRSRTGALSQLVLKRTDFTRTHHALYSFAVWGRETKLLYDMNDKNSFVGNTPFDWLYKNNGKMIAMDTNNFFTFAHYVEEANNVDYRFVKDFHSKYIDEWDRESERTYSMFVRYLDERHVSGNPNFHRWLRAEGVQHEQSVQGIPIWLIGFKESFELLTHDIKTNSARNLIIHDG